MSNTITLKHTTDNITASSDAPKTLALGELAVSGLNTTSSANYLTLWIGLGEGKSPLPLSGWNKENNLSGAVSTVIFNNLTANRALVSNSDGKIAVSAVTATELGYLDGVTSAIQTQLNNKLSITGTAVKATADASGNEITRFYESLKPIGATIIPANANLNSIEYLRVGTYLCSNNTTVGTLSNCPVSSAFIMKVYSPISATIDNESTATGYRVREIMNYQGTELIQCVASSTAGSWTYYDWGEKYTSNNLGDAPEIQSLEGQVNTNTNTINSLNTQVGTIQTTVDEHGELLAYFDGDELKPLSDEYGIYMTASHTVELYEPISEQNHGIIIVWSAYESGAAKNYNFHYQFIPKIHTKLYDGLGVNSGIMASETFGNVGGKYLYIHDTYITGNDYNSSTGTASSINYNNKYWVLRRVYGK